MTEPQMRVLIVDDEPLAREGLRILFDREPDIEIVGEAADGSEAVRLIRTLRPDLVLLDVQMPRLDGFGVVEEVGVQRMPPVVFVTAHDGFAIRAFEAQALDYLLKPIDGRRFARTLDRARERIASARSDDLARKLGDLLGGLGRQTFLERFTVTLGNRITFVLTADVDWIAAEGNYARLHVAGREHLIRETMQALESKLDPARFIRIRRSTIVRIDSIQELEPLFQGEYALRLKDGTRLTSSRGYRGRIQALLDAGR